MVIGDGMEPLEAVRAWRDLADGLSFVDSRGHQRTWADYVARGRGATDEESLVQPLAFPRFAEELLGFHVGQNLAPEHSEGGGKPDFTPADAVTHDFVFEVKSTRARESLEGFDDQVVRYLHEGGSRVRRVVLTNLVGIRTFDLDDGGRLRQLSSISLTALLLGRPEVAAATGEGRRLAEFLDAYRFRELRQEEKLLHIRAAPDWNPLMEVTNPDWISRRLLGVVEILRLDAHRQIDGGALENDAVVESRNQLSILEELRGLEWRLGGDLEDARDRELLDYLSAASDSPPWKALEQYVAHVAYFATTRLTLVRIWEDLKLLDPVLYDGGFNKWMESFDDVLRRVVDYSFSEAGHKYPTLFERENNYTWYQPTEPAYVNAIYELANTYFGAIESDVLGDVYQSLLERVDRKNIGQFYTPRDIISLIWDLVGLDEIAAESEVEERELRVLDIATGSAGFLVEAARRLRKRAVSAHAAGASISKTEVVRRLAAGLVGVEIQRFPAYLAEINLLVQIGLILGPTDDLAVPPLGVLCADTMGLHEPERLFEESTVEGDDLLISDPAREADFAKVKDVSSSGFYMDVACGNPPYIGETKAAPILQATRERFPYWEQFVAPHLDVLYWFLILGVSKLRTGGRFGFITTEYWLRADGARPLREYLGSRCRIDRLVLFRDMRLFPDAPGQHSLIVTGERVASPDASMAQGDPSDIADSYPLVSIYEGPNLSIRDRRVVLGAITAGRKAPDLASFRSKVAPNRLAGGSWAEVILSPSQIARRKKLIGSGSDLHMTMEEGVIATPDSMREAYAEELPVAVLREVGWPHRRHGIFVLKSDEVGELGTLTKDEERILSPVVNTRDVFPYAAVLPADASRLIYLPPPGDREGMSEIELHELDFPDRLPNIRRHLERFHPLLLGRVEAWGERRPWWSVHRARPNIIASEGTGPWSNYALTTRWGAGGRLIAGLAPRHTVPASGLNALIPGTSTAAYIVGVLNSTVIQEMAESLPPGELRQEDFASLGIRLFDEVVSEVSEDTLALADIVHELVQRLSTSWPALPLELREDPTLGAVQGNAWVPSVGPSSSWGPVARVSWVSAVESSGPQARKIADASFEHDLFGASIVVEGVREGHMRIRLSVDDEGLARSMVAYVRGLAAEGRSVRDVATVLVPVEFEVLARAFHEALGTLENRTQEYREHRQRVDSLIGALL
ncbi:MAG: N-6 DNA methylase [Actinomycetota bacterium]